MAVTGLETYTLQRNINTHKGVGWLTVILILLVQSRRVVGIDRGMDNVENRIESLVGMHWKVAKQPGISILPEVSAHESKGEAPIVVSRELFQVRAEPSGEGDVKKPLMQAGGDDEFPAGNRVRTTPQNMRQIFGGAAT